ncbi:MAG TPA: CRISPR-associated endonuclease Cas2 [Deltaproteobacteria bacterium]|nr:CRISPR-associated endonuclease Cas2 [Deltaproteobacteria bacterium]HQB37809.1 CRISPR-associated endonuclease Cas2 [Deltaproteobacteria bacterium]
MKRYVVIAYDIEKDRKRREVVKLLHPWGIRVNKSVFECYLTDNELSKLCDKLKKKVQKGADSILVYRLCGSCLEKVERFGTAGPERPVVKIF